MIERLPLRAAGLVVALAAPALAGCSGATEQLVELAPSDGGAPASSSSTGSGDNGSDDASTGDNGNGSGNGSTSGNGSGSTNGNGNGNDPGPAPPQCPPGGTQQTTASGDSQSDATPFDTVACGTLTAGETYFWTFTLPASASKFGLSFTGGLQIEITIDGTTVSVVPGASLPFRTNDPYYVQVSPLGSTTESYVFVVSEK
jgi:hypothetical protein